MAIRLRKIGNKYIALCAAENKEKDGDIYLHDGWHHALAQKFMKEFKKIVEEKK